MTIIQILSSPASPRMCPSCQQGVSNPYLRENFTSLSTARTYDYFNFSNSIRQIFIQVDRLLSISADFP